MDEYIAIVQKVLAGKHGAYAVALSDKLGLITFSLHDHVWKEKDMPEEGIYVVLSDLRRKRAGWRANSARFQRPSDQQSAISVTSNQ